MVLVDTSVWISHLREGNNELVSLLNNGEVLCHPFIVGEIACGNLKNRMEIIRLLKSLSGAIVAEAEEILQFIEYNELMGKGLGYIDIHLLASAMLMDAGLWTLDRRLDNIARKILP
ncbi:MAG: type II toxin-antitoxin system VapC family toxin [Deltaproteobacteria bacterium]|nr:type II toxin-antitoxin system VapC family toxin [Deltaproteobacteria bacterium]MCL5891783.1 type II toxin-antitoxin system VapC family toxin [Deltaproteobacteria bacterium]